MSTFTLLGAGMMSSALTPPMIDRGHTVRLVATPLDRAILADLQAGQPHTTLRYPLPEGVTPYPPEAAQEAMDGADFIIIGVSSAGIPWAAAQLKAYGRADVPVLMITKGLALHDDQLQILPDALRRLSGLADLQPCAVVGPCIAGELARRAETAVIFTGRNPDHLRALQAALATPYYRVLTSPAALSLEVCAALKNAYALAFGFAAGLHERRGGAPGSIALHNLESAVFSQALAEMQRVVALLGGEPSVVVGLPGAGDLMVTCNGGRTGRFGRWLGLGLPLPDAIARMEGATLEAVEILTILRAADLPRATLPLLQHLMAVALDGAAVDLPLHAFDFGVPETA